MMKCREHLQCPFILDSIDTMVLEKIPPPDQDWFGIADIEQNETERYCTTRLEGELVVRLDDKVKNDNRYAYIDVRQSQPDLTELLSITGDEPFILHPGEFVLGQTLEWVELPDDLVARLEGKSSLGRLGLLIHSTAGYVDPGWKGNLTLELSNVASLPIALYQGMRIGQISFFRMSSPVERPYGSAGLGSKYQGQSEPTASAFHRDFAAGRRLDPAPTD